MFPYVNKSDGSLINLHEHTVEMDYSGQKDYKYYETIGTNNYDDVLFKMDIWSVDAGYTIWNVWWDNLLIPFYLFNIKL